MEQNENDDLFRFENGCWLIKWDAIVPILHFRYFEWIFRQIYFIPIHSSFECVWAGWNIENFHYQIYSLTNVRRKMETASYLINAFSVAFSSIRKIERPTTSIQPMARRLSQSQWAQFYLFNFVHFFFWRVIQAQEDLDFNFPFSKPKKKHSNLGAYSGSICVWMVWLLSNLFILVVFSSNNFLSSIYPILKLY